MQAPRRFFLAILHKPSGGFLPVVSGYGFTRCEPTREEPPRLFAKKGPCKQALDRWLEGALHEGAYNEEMGEVTLVRTKMPHRRAADMEIVEIEMVVRSLSEAQLRML